jgi:hypothetical protein
MNLYRSVITEIKSLWSQKEGSHTSVRLIVKLDERRVILT